MNQPFRSRPKIQRPPEEVADEQIIDGVIAEEPEQGLVPYDEVVRPPFEPPIIQREVPRRAHRRMRVAKPDLFMLAVVLIAGGIFFTLLNVANLSESVVEGWPAVTLGLAVLWSLIALIRRDSTAFLSGAGAAGLSASLLMDTQDIASFGETVVGVILISVGLAIVVRGFLLRPTTR